MINKANCCTNPADMKGSFKIALPVPDSEFDFKTTNPGCCNSEETNPIKEEIAKTEECCSAPDSSNSDLNCSCDCNPNESEEQAGINKQEVMHINIDGKQAYACGTNPKNGMKIIVNRPDLKVLRRNRLQAYAEGIKAGKMTPCNR